MPTTVSTVATNRPGTDGQAAPVGFAGRQARWCYIFAAILFVEACDGENKAVLINPTVRPFDDLVAYLGPQVNPYTGESYELTKAHFDELEALWVSRISMPERYFLLVQTGARTYSEGFRLRWDQVDWEHKLIRWGSDVKTPLGFSCSATGWTLKIVSAIS